MLAALAFAALPNAAYAQDADEDDGGLEVGLTFTGTLRSEDGNVFAQTRLDFDLASVTRRDRFELSFGGAYNAGQTTGLNDGLDDPRVSLLYQHSTRNALLEVTGRYTRDDIRNLVLNDDVDDPALVIDDGVREDFDAGFRALWGRESPFGGEAALTYAGRRFSDTTATGLFDNDTVQARLRFDFEIDQTITAFTRFSYREIDRDGGTDSKRISFAIGADMAVTPTLDANAEIGYSRTSESGPNADPDGSGLNASLRLDQALPNGSLTGAFSTNIGENGRNSSLRVTRAFDLRGGFLRLGAGFGELGGETHPLFTLAYAHESKRSRVTFNFDQSFSSSTAGNGVLNSRLAVNYRHSLSQRTNYNLGVNFTDADPIDPATAGSQQLSVNMSVDHALTDTWAVIGGVTHTRRKPEGGTRTTNDEIFVGLRAITRWRP